MPALRDFEIRAIRLLAGDLLTDAQLVVLEQIPEPSRYEYTGSGYFLTLTDSSLPTEAGTLSYPDVVGEYGAVTCGFVVFVGDHELTLECHAWGAVDVPSDFRDHPVSISTPASMSSTCARLQPNQSFKRTAPPPLNSSVSQHMKHLRILVVLMLVASPLYVAAAPGKDPLCAPLRAFARSVAPGQTHTIEFHTVWGGDFKSVTARTMYAQQCIDHGYQPAKVACKSLMQHGAIEFADNNAKSAVSCLSPATRFGSPVTLDRLDVSFAFGTPNRGSNITVSYGPATTNMRGMVMLITAEGY